MEASSATINNLTNQLADVDALDALEARADPRMCKSCATIFSNTHASRLVLRNTVSIRRRHQSLLDTQESGCRLCRLLVAIVDLRPVELKDGRLVQAGEEKEEDEARSEDIVESLFAVDGEELHNIRITCKIENKRERFAFVQVSAHKDDPAAQQIPQRSLHPKVNCPQTFAKVRQWLDECYSNHNTCNECQLGPTKSDVRPTFLLNIARGRDTVFLEQRLVGVKYAALSYRWGTEQPHATTLENLDAYAKQGILFQTLPRTIQDAAAVCRELGLDFLWVDSLCIPQDSPADMERELAIMGAIYHNAHVVISASSAQSCNDGFLDKSPLVKETIKVPFGENGSVDFLPKLSTEGLPIGHDDDDPLDDRAWAYQESFMARRLLAFTTHEVIWGCCQTGGDSGGRRRPYITKVHFNDSCRTVDAPEFKHWCFIVETFSRRKLTRENDKLPALSSVAELFERSRGGTYLAGVWLEGGRQLLTWGMTHLDDRIPPTRPTKWRAPSWSYMSIDGPTGFEELNGHYRSGRPISEHSGFGWEASKFSVKLRYGTNPYGEVTEGSMQFRGQLMEVRIGNAMERTQRQFDVEQLLPRGGFERRPGVDPSTWLVVFDAVVPTSSEEPKRVASCYGPLPLTDRFWWLPMWHAKQSVDSKGFWEQGYRHGERLLGLALACLPDGKYHRVGYILCKGEEGESLVAQIEKLEFAEFTFV